MVRIRHYCCMQLGDATCVFLYESPFIWSRKLSRTLKSYYYCALEDLIRALVAIIYTWTCVTEGIIEAPFIPAACPALG